MNNGENMENKKCLCDKIIEAVIAVAILLLIFFLAFLCIFGFVTWVIQFKISATWACVIITICTLIITIWMREKKNETMILQIIRYSKMLIPQFGTFTNDVYEITGLMWFGRLFGKCVKSKYPSVINACDWKNLPQYHLSSDIVPQFNKIIKNEKI